MVDPSQLPVQQPATVGDHHRAALTPDHLVAAVSGHPGQPWVSEGVKLARGNRQQILVLSHGQGGDEMVWAGLQNSLATERILGAAILGVGGDEIVHCILDVMYADAPYTVIRRAVHIHPTVAELIPTMLADLKPLGVE